MATAVPTQSNGVKQPTSRKSLVVGEEFARAVSGRFRRHGLYSGEQFRQDVLEPSFAAGVGLDIDMSDVLGVGSSFLDEAFGQFVADHGRAQFEAFFTVTSSTHKYLDGDLTEVLSAAAAD